LRLGADAFDELAMIFSERTLIQTSCLKTATGAWCHIVGARRTGKGR